VAISYPVATSKRGTSDQKKINLDPAVLDERQTAAYLCIKLETLNELATSGEIPHLLIAGNLRYRIKDLDEYINSRVTTSWGSEQDRTPTHRSLKQADLIREFCRVNYLEPAKSRGEETVRIRCGDVARGMGLSQRLPAVVAAIGANKFERLFNVTKVAEEGPGNGANKIFMFKVGLENISGGMGVGQGPLTNEEQTPWRERMPRPTIEPHSGNLENKMSFAEAFTFSQHNPRGATTLMRGHLVLQKHAPPRRASIRGTE